MSGRDNIRRQYEELTDDEVAELLTNVTWCLAYGTLGFVLLLVTVTLVIFQNPFGATCFMLLTFLSFMMCAHYNNHAERILKK